MSGTVNPNGQDTKWRFQYGKTASYGSQTSEVSAGSGNSARSVSAALQFPSPGATYHYRLVAGNVAGADRSFTTSGVFAQPAAPVLDTTAPRLAISKRRVRLGSRRRLRVRVRCAAFEPEPCRGRLRLYTGRRRIRIASASFTIQPGSTARVRLRLSRRGGRLLERKGRLRVLAVARARDSAGNLGQKRARFTLLPRR